MGTREPGKPGLIALWFHVIAQSRTVDRSRITAMLQFMKTHFVAVQSRGTIALPADLRRRLHLDEPGAQIEIIEREDGLVELRPLLPVPADQRWFWSERWQAMEREAAADIAAGRVTVVDGPDALFELLDRGLDA
jgi:AbrB family looped-hinge helix DNA binding protein